MDKNKIAIAQYWTSNLSYGKFTKAINSKYCEEKGYTYFLEDDSLKITQNIIGRAITWYKPKFLLEVFEKLNPEYVLFLDADVTFTHRYAIKEAFEEICTGNYEMVSTNPVYKGEFDIRASIMFALNKCVTWFLSKVEPFAIGGFTMVNRQLFIALGGYDEQATQSEDWLLSKRILPHRFKLIPDLMTQDNRRFKRYGYTNMIKLLWRNWKNRNNLKYFYKDQNYWD